MRNMINKNIQNFYEQFKNKYPKSAFSAKKIWFRPKNNVLRMKISNAPSDECPNECHCFEMVFCNVKIYYTPVNHNNLNVIPRQHVFVIAEEANIELKQFIFKNIDKFKLKNGLYLAKSEDFLECIS